MPVSPSDMTASALMQRAAEKAGSDDWGADEFVAPLELLLSGCRERDALTPLGWTVLRGVVLRHLQNRLLTAAVVRADPSVAQRPLPVAIVVTGLPRTGTTALQSLLALDPANRFLGLWEALRPAPLGDAADRARRVARARDWLDRFYELVPSFPSVHPLTPEGPEECDTLLQNAFVSQHFDDMFDAPPYSDWLAAADLRPHYAHYGLQLRVLGGARPAAGWILKSPLHVGHLEALCDALDPPLVVHCHRPPLAAVSSYASLVERLRRAYSEAVSAPAVGRQALQRSAAAITRALAFRDAAGPDRFVDVSHRAIVGDPIAVVHAIYRRAGRTVDPGFEAGMRRWVSQNPRGRYGEHRHRPEEFGLTDGAVGRALGPYVERFGEWCQ